MPLPAVALALAIPFFVGFVWAPHWPLALVFLAVPTFLNYFYLSPVRHARAGGSAAARARAGRRAAAAGDEPHRPRARARRSSAPPSDCFRPSHPAHSLQLAFYTLVPFYVLAVLSFLWLARALKRRGSKRRHPVIVAICVSLALLVACLPVDLRGGADGPPVVDAPAGKVQGEAVGDAATCSRAFRTRCRRSGALRWKPPLPLPRWKGTREATAFGPACVQPKPQAGQHLRVGPAVDRARTACRSTSGRPPKRGSAPVFVWIHGGSLVAGSGSGHALRRRGSREHGVIVVTINYRLGVLGYLAHPALSAESPQQRLRQLRPARSDRGAALGEEQHRRLRRRCRERHDRGRIRRRPQRDVPDGRARRARPVRQGDRAKRLHDLDA